MWDEGLTFVSTKGEKGLLDILGGAELANLLSRRENYLIRCDIIYIVKL